MYFLAIDTTSLKFAFIKISFAFCELFSLISFATFSSSSKDKRGILPICCKYTLTESSAATLL